MNKSMLRQMLALLLIVILEISLLQAGQPLNVEIVGDLHAEAGNDLGTTVELTTGHIFQLFERFAISSGLGKGLIGPGSQLIVKLGLTVSG